MLTSCCVTYSLLSLIPILLLFSFSFSPCSLPPLFIPLLSVSLSPNPFSPSPPQVAEEMEAAGVLPGPRTFLALLQACGIAGWVSDAYVGSPCHANAAVMTFMAPSRALDARVATPCHAMPWMPVMITSDRP